MDKFINLGSSEGLLSDVQIIQKLGTPSISFQYLQMKNLTTYRF